MKLFTYLIVITLTAYVCSGCMGRARLRIIVPNGYHGLIRVVEGPLGASADANGAITVRLNASGIGTVRKFQDLRPPLNPTAYISQEILWADGAPVPEEGPRTANQNTLHSVPLPKGELRFFIGTHDQHLAFLGEEQKRKEDNLQLHQKL